MPKYIRSFTIAQKLDIINQIKQSTVILTSIKLKIHKSILYKWLGKELEFLTTKNKNKTKKMGNHGRKAKHSTHEQTLYNQIIQQRRQGIPLSWTIVREQMLSLVADDDPTFKASSGWAYGFAKRYFLTLRVPTLKRPNSNFNVTFDNQQQEKKQSFIAYTNNLISANNYNEDHIINMDETPVWFDSPINKTVEVVGSKKVAIKTTGNDKDRVTVVLAVTKSGKMLTPTIIEKSASKAAREAAGDTRYSTDDVVQVYKQKNKNMTSHLMCDWIKNVLSPLFPNGARKLLIMDSAPAHKTEEVKQLCRRLIPGGLTGELQPLDISVNKSFKSKLKKLYIQDLVKGKETNAKNKTRERMKKMITSVGKVCNEFDQQIVRNGFNKALSR